MIDIPISDRFYSTKFPTENEWFSQVHPADIMTEQESLHVQKMLDTFYSVTAQYFQGLNITLPSYIFKPFSLAKYNETSGMNYHTDFQQDRGHFPGEKFHTTCLFYLNDNYEGGEISFAILNDTHSEVVEYFDYKPKAGDVVVFPSTEPFFHGVKPVLQGSKYIIRTYWQYEKEPDPDYDPDKAEELYNTLKDEIKVGMTLQHNGMSLRFNGRKK